MNDNRGWTGPPGLVAIGVAAILLAGVAAALFETLDGGFAQFIGRFHPLVVHLPIGVLLLVAAAELASFKQPVKQRLDPVLLPVLGFLLLTTVTAFVVGALLAGGGGYPDRLLSLHKQFAFATVVLLSLCLISFGIYRRRGQQRWRTVYRVALGASVVALGFGAHHGGSMTHGETYLVHYAPGFAKRLLGLEAPDAAPDQSKPNRAERKAAVLYADVVQPLLTKYCVDCHGPSKAKGDLRLDSHAALLKGGGSGPAVVAGAPDKSPLVSFMELPVQHDDRMPPEGKPAPNAAERALIRWWVARGADPDERVEQVLPPAQVLELLKTYAKPQAVSEVDAPPETGAPLEAPKSETREKQEAEAALEGVEAEALLPTPVVRGNSGQVYEDLVRPLLAARCAGCHGAKKQKGSLRVDSIAALRQGGDAGPSVVPGHPERSPLVSRIELPLSHDEHMPPKNKPQLSSAQLQLLKWWIADGARADRALSALPSGLAGAEPVVAAPAETPSDEPGSASAGDATAGAEPPEQATPVALVPAVSRRLSSDELSSLPAVVHLYDEVVQPMLEARCGECHVGEFVMGGLNVGTYGDLMESGTVVPGAPQESELLARVLLPLGNDERMPPDDGEPVPAHDAALLEFWIAEGADKDGSWSRDQLPAAVAVASFERLSAAAGAEQRVSASETERPAPGPPPVAGGGCGACSRSAAGASLTPYLGGLLVFGVWGRRYGRASDRRSRGLS